MGQFNNIMAPIPAIPVLYATWNPADIGTGIALSGGNLIATSSALGGVRSTTSHISGMWYVEYTITTSSNQFGCGFATSAGDITGYFPDAFEWGVKNLFGDAYYTNNGGNSYLGTTFPATGHILSMILDISGGVVKFYKDGVLLTSSTFTASTALYLYFTANTSPTVITLNSGASPFTYYTTVCTACGCTPNPGFY